ncbi:LysR family transcriptional regulator [Paenibacillus sp. MWE-103]|uniref:LysR family transcriptional regulator n=1 Tax=Paenibacillus artemisiicola TaxID=1172618 RepID=A0ABS3W4Z5_9BACL|nr:LysR family transcriptional regulator [Paenibacillus artemisiicola]MBO7743215.1 LysR family transcriptional regulator [Paenibacillus artemisiicola]
MNLYGLIVFHHVAATGSVTKAAEALGISQPAVTAHVRNMSAELGQALLAPKGRGIFLTEAGSRLAAHAARLYALQREIARDMNAYAAGAAGELRLAATSLAASFLLPELLAAYRETHPGVAIALRTLRPDDALEALRRYDADAAFVSGGCRNHPGLFGQVLREEELWFVAAPHHPLAGRRVPFRTIANEPFVMRELDCDASEQLAALCEVRGMPMPRGAIQVSGAHEALHAAAAGIGLALMSALEARKAVGRGELARVKAEGVELRSPVMLYTRAEEDLPPQAARFLGMLKDDSSSRPA